MSTFLLNFFRVILILTIVGGFVADIHDDRPTLQENISGRMLPRTPNHGRHASMAIAFAALALMESIRIAKDEIVAALDPAAKPAPKAQATRPGA